MHFALFLDEKGRCGISQCMRFINYFTLIVGIVGLFFLGCGPKKQTPPLTPSTDKTDDSELKSEEHKSTTAPEVPNIPFTMAGGGAKHLHRVEVEGPKQKPVVDATFSTGARVFASPVLGPDGTVYVGSLDGTFSALKKDGSLRWSHVCSESIFSTAAISKSGLIYVGCDNDSLLGFTTDGVLRFTYRISHDMDSPPVIGSDGTIYTGGDGLHAISSGGKRKWKALLDGHVNGSIGIRSDGVVVAGSHDNRVYGFDKDGTAVFAFGTGGKVQSTPAILENDDAVIGSDSGFVYRLSPLGAMRWKFDVQSPVRGGVAVSFDEQTLYFGAMNGSIYAINAEDGTKIWEFKTGGPVRATPMLDSSGRLYVGSQDHNLYALNANSGEVIWFKDLFSQIDSTVLLAGEKKLIVGADNGIVYFLTEKEVK